MSMVFSSLSRLRPVAYALCYGIAIAAIYALNGLLVIDAAKNFDGLAAIWSANAILLCAISGQRAGITVAGYAGAFAASLFVNAYAGYPALVAFCFSVANLFEVALALYLLDRFIGRDADNFDAGNLHRFVAIMVAATALSASLAITGLAGGIVQAWQSWFLSDLLGMLFVVPILSTLRRGFSGLGPKALLRQRLVPFGLVSAFVGIVTGAVFLQNTMPVLFLISVPLLVAVFRHGRLGAVLSLLVVAGISVTATVAGAGPIAGSRVPAFEQLLLLQLFLASQLIITLPIASLLEHRAREAEESLEREQNLRVQAERAQWEAQRSNRARAIAMARDELTGVLSRTRVMARLVAQLARAQRSGESLAVAIFDIDHFKQINDRFGHLVGDEVLATIGRISRDCLPRRVSIGRIGGEEFLILLPDSDLSSAATHVERLRAMVASGTRQATGVSATISVGIAVANTGSTAKTLLAEADLAMYRAKTAGRNQAKIAA